MLFSSQAKPHQDGKPLAGHASLRQWFFSFVWLAAATGLLCSCALLDSKSSTAEPEPKPAELTASSTNSHGYALLYDVVKDEKDVSKLRFIKRERPELKSLLQEIAKANRDACSALEAFAKTNHDIDIKNQGLPVAEVQARAAIGKFKENAILHGKDKQLEIELLLSENEALTYASHLAGVVAATEADPRRKQFLQQLGTGLSALQQKVVALLLKNYS
jgi:hypothetical protein